MKFRFFAAVSLFLTLSACSLSELDRFYLGPDAACGSVGGACCAQSTCYDSAICTNGTCAACGDPTQPCCGTQCHTGATCISGTCASCGGGDEPCCDGSRCDVDTLTCEAGTCRGCIQKVVAGGSHACALKTNGTIWCWGANADGQLGVVTTTAIGPLQAAIIDAVDIAAGRLNTCAARNTDGTVWCWGASNEILAPAGGVSTPGLPGQIQPLLFSDKVAVGFAHACAIAKVEHDAWCWGKDDSGQAALPPGGTVTTPARAGDALFDGGSIVVGFAHSCAGTSQGVKCWGNDNFGQLGDGATGASQFLPQDVRTALATFVPEMRLSAGFAHTCAATTSQFGYCWGSNMFGQLGNGTTSDSNVAARVLTDAIDVAAGRVHTCAIKADHSVWCWGNNSYGEIGQDPVAVTQSSTPMQVAQISDAVQIAAGGPGYSDADDFSCALLRDGSIRCWGSDLYGQLGDMEMRSEPNFRSVKVALSCP